MSVGVVAAINLLLDTMPLPHGIEWAKNGDSVIFHRVPSTTFRAWLIVTPKPNDELLVVSDALEFHIVTAAEAAERPEARAALSEMVDEHIARFVHQLAAGTAHKIPDCGELPK